MSAVDLSLEDQIKAQGDLVRSLKSQKTDKDKVIDHFGFMQVTLFHLFVSWHTTRFFISPFLLLILQIWCFLDQGRNRQIVVTQGQIEPRWRQ